MSMYAGTQRAQDCGCVHQEGMGESDGLGFAFLIPLVTSLIGAATSGGGMFASSKARNNQLKVIATNKTDEVERHLVVNRDWYISLPNPTLEEWQAALSYFDQQWQAWVGEVGQLGEVGQRSINERKRGGVNSWGDDWFELYLDPIAQHKPVEVVTQTPVVNGVGTQPTNGTGPVVTVENVGSGDMGKILAIGGLALGAWFMFNKKGKR